MVANAREDIMFDYYPSSQRSLSWSVINETRDGTVREQEELSLADGINSSVHAETESAMPSPLLRHTAGLHFQASFTVLQSHSKRSGYRVEIK